MTSAGRGPGLRIATVYRRDRILRFTETAMDMIRWVRMSEALARLGHRVDVVVDAVHPPRPAVPTLRYVPYAEVDWDDYDVVKTLFHEGFESLRHAGGAHHPFVVSKLGSVVGPDDQTPGVYFFGELREELWRTQERIAGTSRYVTVLTESARALWRGHFGDEPEVLMVPTGVDRDVPPPGPSPYRAMVERIALYLGNLYGPTCQPETNLVWQERLNAIGAPLRRRGVRLCFAGPGDGQRLDPSAVTRLPVAENGRAWDYQRHADVGIALAQGPVQQNESSKIYYYLRAGLPVVAERPIPNASMVEEVGLGAVTDYGDVAALVDRVEAASRRAWETETALRRVRAEHAWDVRARVYDERFRSAGLYAPRIGSGAVGAR